MDEKTVKEDGSLLKAVEGRDLAIGIQISAQVGPNRSVTMTSGVPIDMPLNAINRYVDKMFGVIERQNHKMEIEQAKRMLEGAERDLATSRRQQQDTEMSFREAHTRGQRRGEWKPSNTEQAKLDNFKNTQVHLEMTVIPKLNRDILELEKSINLET